VLQIITAALFWFSNPDDEDTVLGRHLGAFTLDRSNLFGEYLWNAQRKAVAPSQKFDLHNGAYLIMYLQCRYETSIGQARLIPEAIVAGCSRREVVPSYSAASRA
jgi:hypothetical protein